MTIKKTFARRAWTDQRLLRRSCESLLGIVTGLLADAALNDAEIRFLDLWLVEHDEISTSWPGEVIFARIRAALEDGVITEAERQHLQETLSSLIGGTLQGTGAVAGAASTLAVDENAIIRAKDRSFCFTGQFLYGTRPKCEEAVTALGGECCANIRKDMDYLVIGTLSSHEWAHTSYGRKIEKAKEYQAAGCSIKIISEAQWLQGMGLTAGV